MKVLKFSSIATVLVLMATTVFAQTKTEAIQAYNAGLEAVTANNYEKAIASLNQALTIANQIGPDGVDIKTRAENQIPTVYFRKASAQYKAFQKSKDVKDLNSAITAFQEVVTIGEKFNDTKVAPRAKGVIPQLYYTKSVIFYNNGEFTKADQAVDEAINKNSNYAVAYYQKAKILKKQSDTNDDGIIDNNVDQLLNWYDRAIQVGDATNQGDIADKAREAAHDELLAVGTRASEEGNVTYAIEMLTTALEYNSESPNIYYRLSEAYNKNSNAQKAVDNAQKALEYENGGKTDKAKIYFELGYAQQTLGNKSQACDAFTNALYGSFKSPAEHKMEFELKCGKTTP